MAIIRRAWCKECHKKCLVGKSWVTDAYGKSEIKMSCGKFHEVDYFPPKIRWEPPVWYKANKKIRDSTMLEF